MGYLKINVDEEFVNNLIDRVVEANTNVQGLKNLNVELKEDGIHFQVDVNVLKKEAKFDTLIKMTQKPETLSKGIMDFTITGDEGVRKILEGVFKILSKFTEVFDSADNKLTIDLNKIDINPLINDTLSSLAVKELTVQDKEFKLEMNYRD
ncbi:MAG: hypothetical protein ACQESN_08275 [Thermotogota bacterium]